MKDIEKPEEGFQRSSNGGKTLQTGTEARNKYPKDQLADLAEGKRQRELIPSAFEGPPLKRSKYEHNGSQEAELDGGEDQEPIDYWTKTGRWPKRYAEQIKIDYTMRHSGLFKKASNSLRRKRSETELSASQGTPSDRRSRNAKNIGYDSVRYDIILETAGVLMRPSPLGITEDSKKTYQNLLSADQQIPSNTLFRDDLFETACTKLAGANETRVIRDLTQLIVPSAETLATFGSQHLDILSETCNAR
ncbi:hypothetical protein TWF506_003214 [Arthrobotrys conoides]|uniref:DUF7924 domain-containing protein n=1 Tax=Arthrobotrys conoides TaxID=74498 RepID=A0AAN8RJG1_9PEZI